MEDVLELYEEMYDAKRPVICFDEKSVQLVAETRVPSAVAPGRPKRYDYEYERRGTANIFMAVEPLGAWRQAGTASGCRPRTSESASAAC